MQHRDKVILEKIISEIDIAINFMGKKEISEFLEDEMVKRAIGMTVINIGELVKNVTDEIRTKHKNVPWKQVAGFRDITAHKYQTLRMDDVYMTIKVNFPELRNSLLEILKDD